MIAPSYVDGITDTVTHSIVSSLAAGHIATGTDTVSIWVVSPDRWFIGDFAVVSGRDGRAFAGEVQDMDVCTGQVTIRGARQLTAQAALLPGPRSPGQRRRRSHPHRGSPATGTSRRTQPGRPATAPDKQGNYDHERADSANRY